MQKIFRLCLWQVVLGIFTVSLFFISTLSTSGLVVAQEVQTQERGIRMRGPKSTDVFPYDRYGPITKRDTLWKIALTVRPDNRLSVYQVMEALYQANPHSFVNSNFNHLVGGQYLKIPSFERMMSVNKAVAKQKSRQDDKDWQKKQPKKVAKKAITPQIPAVNKQDLDTVKIEINNQLKKIDHEQQKRLQNIQSDVLDSIDGLQAILKENKELRQRLTSFNSQLGIMQKEVAKGKEIKLQMDDMIKLQQALLDKAQAREQELLLEKQQTELEKNNIFSSLWFIVLMATLPAILILLVVALIFKRRKTETTTSDSEPKKNSKDKAENTLKEPKAEIDEIDELSLDDELSLEDELSLDDELSIDLHDEDKNEDDVIHLDDDDDDSLDELDDLEDILLDDDDSDELEGGELGQDGLDSLLMEDDAIEIEEQEAEESEALVNDQLDQSDLDDLLGDLGDDELAIEDEEPSGIEEVDIEEVDIDDILMNADSEKELSTDDDSQADITDPDDIDALLDSMLIDEEEPSAEEKSSTDNDSQADITDPDDIDALLDSMSIDEEEPSAEENPSTDDNSQADITDPDDIDALLDSMSIDEEESSTDDNSQADITDPDDIDALLDSMLIDAEEPSAEEKPAEKNTIKQDESQNKSKIESLTDEYVAPLLATDFSDVLTKSTAADLVETDVLQESLADDDIDSLIEDAENNTKEQDAIEKTEFTIGDDLVEEFDEDTLTELLSESTTEHAIELTPDFSDQNVLADLLNENEESNGNNQISEASEINDIRELDSLDFDELLANIEEESSVASRSVDFNENLDVGDDISLADFDNTSSTTPLNDDKQSTENKEDFLSVDSLLSESQDEESSNEPYDKANIDVGLNEFPEFTDGVNQIDVDVDENGMAAKLDLAKVYIEIGDQDNALAILLEVVKQGDIQQQVTAQELLDNL
ncbi:MAG: hypothetical protein JKX76_12755 [Colwellia sp.]|nr:hypothetical protein [Colwellia sp.]